MITKEQIDKVLAPEGLEMIAMDPNGEFYMYSSIHTGIGVRVYTKRNSFELVYSIRGTVFTMNSGECSPLYEESLQYNQFHKMYRKFYEIVLILRRDYELYH